MPAGQLQVVLRHLRKLAGVPETGGVTDGQLLEHFVTQHDEAAFELLVRRYERMVWGVCRRLLADHQDAEDAFQAAFVVLVRKAGTVAQRDSVACWLYQVAYRVAVRARANRTRIAAREQRGIDLASAVDPHDLPAEVVWRDLRPLLDQELNRLPEKYRAPVVLCYLQGKSYAEAAQQLGCPKGTVSIRLTRARELLRGQLARRGLTLTAALLASGLSQETSFGSVPATLLGSTVRCATLLGMKGTVVGVSVSPQIATLAENILHALFVTQAKLALAVLLAATALTVGASFVARQTLAAKPDPEKQREEPKQVQRSVESKAKGAQQVHTDFYGDPLPSRALARMGTVPWRHAGSITGLAFAPDGSTLTSAGWRDGSLRVWEVPSGRPLRRIDSGDSQLTGLVSSPDGTLLVSAGFTWNPEKRQIDGTTKLWELATGKLLRRMERADWRTSEVAFSPDGATVATGALDGSIRLWDVTTGTECLCIPGPERKDIAHQVISLAFSPDGRTLAAAIHGPEDQIRLWDPASGKELRKLETGTERQTSRLAFSPDGSTLAAVAMRLLQGGERRETDVVLWEVASGKSRRLQGPRHTGREVVNLLDVAFSPDGQTLASTTSDRKLLLWDVATGKLRHKIQGPPNGAYRLVFSPNGRTLAGGGFDDTVYLWDVATGREIAGTAGGHTSAITQTAFSADGRTLVTAGDDSTIWLWETTTGRPRFKLNGHDSWVRAIALSPDGKILASSGLDDTVRLWDAATGKQLRQLPGHGKMGGFRCLAFSPHGKTLASWGDDWTLRVWETGTGKRLLECQPLLKDGPEFPAAGDRRRDADKERRLFAYHASFTPDGRNLVLISEKRTHVVDTKTGQEAFTIPGQPSPRNAFSISPDGTLLVLDSGKMGRLIELATGKEMLQIDGLSEADAVAFSPNSHSVAASVGGQQSTIRVWELRTGQEIVRFQGPAIARSLAFSPDGKTLATGLADTTAIIWDLALAAAPSGQSSKVPPQDLERLWADLAEADARRAYAAIWTLTTVPEKGVALLKERLQPAAELDPQRLRQQIADLGSDHYSVREKASKELEHMGALAEPFLRQTLERNTSPEVQRRVQALLAVPPALIRSPEVLRGARAIEVLERMSTAEARQVLETLAKGAPGARLTQEAKASLDRLAKRHSEAP